MAKLQTNPETEYDTELAIAARQMLDATYRVTSLPGWWAQNGFAPRFPQSALLFTEAQERLSAALKGNAGSDGAKR